MFVVLSLALVASALLSACQQTQPETADQSGSDQAITDKMSSQIPDEDKVLMEITPTVKQDIQREAYDHSGLLDDITNGDATGVVLVTYQDEMYKLQANFENLPLLEDNFFYEGWVVRPKPFHFISTGELVSEDGEWANYYASATDLTDHTMYVLTIEPTDDGSQGEPDPAPAEHLLEGTLSRL